MKKKTSSILLLSAFAALVLAGCGQQEAKSSQQPAESLESSAVVESKAEESSQAPAPASSSTPAPASSSKTPTPASSSTPAPASSSKASSSSAEASSSRPKTWTEMGIVGEYKGGMTSLIVNADGTTSWDTDNTKFPATVTEVGNGVYHIVSASTVAEEDAVDVYTDGTMAYVIHSDSEDNYVMDKNATGASATAFAETEDESKWFGGVELASGHWKYFANLNGVFHFGVTLTVQAGGNINNGGAIFDVTINGQKSTFRVTEAAPSVGAFATVEAFNLTATTYAGEHGDLVVGKTDSGELVYVKLDGSEIQGATLNGDVITVKDGDTDQITKTDEGVFRTCTTTTYTLAPIAHTYTCGTGQVSEPLFHALTGTSGSYSVQVGADGNLWASFRSNVGGVMHITETTQIPTGGSYGDDTFITVYRATPTTNYSQYSTYSYDYVILAEDDGYNPIDSTFDVEANVTYVIKLGAYTDRSKDYSSTTSTYAGETEAMDWTFTANALTTYTGANGDLVIETAGTTVKAISLNGETLSDYTINGNSITTVVSVVDTTDLTNVTMTTTTTVITIDPTAHTYTSTATPVTTSPFQVLGASDTSYTHATDNSGNNWVLFTPAADGIMSISETGMGTISDSYLAVYDLTALGGDLTKLKTAYTNAIKYTDANPAVIDNLAVTGGHTYVIKHGAYGTRDNLIGSTATTATYIGSTMSFNFSYSDLVPVTYTGAAGDLTKWMKDGTLHHVTLAGQTLAGATEQGGAIIVKGTPTYDTTTNPDDPTMTSTDDVYTLDETAGTYVLTNPTVTTNVVNVLTETSTGLSGVLGTDLNLWASFTPAEDGFINIDETVQATSGSSTDTLVAVYEKRATGAAWSDYTGYSSNTYPAGSLKALNAESAYSAGADNGAKPVYVHDLPVTAGHTYIIKIGAYGGNSYTIGSPASATYSAWVGSPEAFSFRFDKIINTTFTGADGDLELSTLAGRLRSVKIAGTTQSNDKVVYDDEAGTISLIGTSQYDLTTDSLDPIETRTDKVYTLDRDAGTYTVADTPVSNHIFGEIKPNTPYTGTTGKDGSYYAKYTAPSDGVIKVTNLVLANSYDYVVVYEAKAGNTAANYKGTYKSADNNQSFLAYKYCSSANAETSEIEVEAGKTYIIKVCSSSTGSYAVGQTASATYQGKTGTIQLSFTPYTFTTATGPQGDLVITTLNGVTKKITLDGTVLQNATLSEDGTTVTVKGATVVDYGGDEPVFSTPTTTYTIADGAYTVSTTTATSPVYQGTLTAAGTYTYTTAENGLGLVKFVAPADGSYTVSVTMTSVDSKLGVYTDAECLTAATATGSNPVDATMSGGVESVTFSATAGQIFYIKFSQYSAFSASITSTTTSTYGGKAASVTIAQNSVAGGSSSSSSSSSSYDPYEDWEDWGEWDY